MKELFDKVSINCSRIATQAYSTSFSLGIKCLAQELRDPIYAIYGFVRFADEIVDSFHDFDKKDFVRFKEETTLRERGDKSQSHMNSFKAVIGRQAGRNLLSVLTSTEMDLTKLITIRWLDNYV